MPSHRRTTQNLSNLKEPYLIKYTRLGLLAKKVEFWSERYDFLYQFYGENGDYNVYIQKDTTEIGVIGGEDSIDKVLKRTVEWCEKANPRIKYPADLIDAEKYLEEWYGVIRTLKGS